MEPLVNEEMATTAEIAEHVRDIAYPLDDEASLEPLMEYIGDSRFVLLGEASHGTSQYYTWRARLSRRLIREKGFSFVAVEGDWPDCYSVNRYAKGYVNSGGSAYEVLHAFERWPTWMWANWEVAAFIEWLRQHNDEREPAQKAGFYGLDVYSLNESMAAIVEYLEENHPEAVATAKEAFRCFEPFSPDGQSYARATAMVPSTCEDEVVELLRVVRERTETYPDDFEGSFSARQNAWVTVGAERYYRSMMRGSRESWNIRDYHMADTLDRLMEHHGSGAKAIVWEHNTHIGDARATDMASAGMVNVGQIVRERHRGDGVVLAGFGSHGGTVIAGRQWGARMERMSVPSARSGSWESLLHNALGRDRLLFSHELREVEATAAPRGHRAIGVVYHPDREWGNYVPTVLPERYDAFLYIDRTDALHPLHLEPKQTEPPELYPWGL